jgi:hypothetical protein
MNIDIKKLKGQALRYEQLQKELADVPAQLHHYEDQHRKLLDAGIDPSDTVAVTEFAIHQDRLQIVRFSGERLQRAIAVVDAEMREEIKLRAFDLCLEINAAIEIETAKIGAELVRFYPEIGARDLAVKKTLSVMSLRQLYDSAQSLAGSCQNPTGGPPTSHAQNLFNLLDAHAALLNRGIGAKL